MTTKLFHRATAVLASTIFCAGVAHAGPAEGELFGYKLGDEYPMGAATKFQRTNGGNWHVVAEHPVAPAAFKRVEVVLTPYTKRIIAITGMAKVAKKQDGYDLSYKYGTLLREKMKGAPCEETKQRDVDLWLLCPALILTAEYHEDSKEVWVHTDVQGELRALDNEEGTRYMAERERARLDALRNDKDANRGL